MFLYRAGSDSEEPEEAGHPEPSGSEDAYLSRIDEELKKDS